jgi:hypothetical protein
VESLQPQVPPLQPPLTVNGRHWSPAPKRAEQEVQTPLLSAQKPQAEGSEPGAHWPPLQQPPWQSWPEEQLVVHFFVVAPQANPTGQLDSLEHPHWYLPDTLMQEGPSCEPEQLAHIPDEPHAVADEPPWQVVPLQQPPLHSWFAEHDFVHWPVEPSHAMPVGQSASVAQPHPFAVHALPWVDFEQSMHWPDAPHAAGAVPEAQKPFALQQPEAQPVCAQLGTHTEAAVSHTEPEPQSAFERHPHWPVTHACPSLAEAQLEHAAPAVPQLELVGVTQVSP